MRWWPTGPGALLCAPQHDDGLGGFLVCVCVCVGGACVRGQIAAPLPRLRRTAHASSALLQVLHGALARSSAVCSVAAGGAVAWRPCLGLKSAPHVRVRRACACMCKRQSIASGLCAVYVARWGFLRHMPQPAARAADGRARCIARQGNRSGPSIIRCKQRHDDVPVTTVCQTLRRKPRFEGYELGPPHRQN